MSDKFLTKEEKETFNRYPLYIKVEECLYEAQNVEDLKKRNRTHTTHLLDTYFEIIKLENKIIIPEILMGLIITIVFCTELPSDRKSTRLNSSH